MAAAPTGDPCYLLELPAELRNWIYEIVLEAEKKNLRGDNLKAITRKGYFNLDVSAMYNANIPSICHLNKEISSETVPMLGIMYGDYMPAFRLNGPSPIFEHFEDWIQGSGVKIVPHLRCFMVEILWTRILVFLDGSEEEYEEMIQSEEVHESSIDFEGLGVAITEYRGQIMDENAPAVAESAAESILEEVEDLVRDSEKRRLTAENLKSLAKFCYEKLKRYDDDDWEDRVEAEDQDDWGVEEVEEEEDA